MTQHNGNKNKISPMDQETEQVPVYEESTTRNTAQAYIVNMISFVFCVIRKYFVSGRYVFGMHFNQIMPDIIDDLIGVDIVFVFKTMHIVRAILYESYDLDDVLVKVERFGFEMLENQFDVSRIPIFVSRDLINLVASLKAAEKFCFEKLQVKLSLTETFVVPTNLKKVVSRRAQKYLKCLFEDPLEKSNLKLVHSEATGICFYGADNMNTFLAGNVFPITFGLHESSPFS